MRPFPGLTSKSLNPLYFVVLLIVFAVFWFIYRTPLSPQPNRSPLAATPDAGATPAEFQPDAHNVDPSLQARLESLRKQVQQEPADTLLVFSLARLLQDAHKPEEAAGYYGRYLSMHPENYQAWLDMTQCLGQASQWSEAEKAAMEMLQHYPGDPSALYNLGAIYANQSRTEDARALWRRIIEEARDAEVKALAEQSLLRLAAR